MVQNLPDPLRKPIGDFFGAYLKCTKRITMTLPAFVANLQKAVCLGKFNLNRALLHSPFDTHIAAYKDVPLGQIDIEAFLSSSKPPANGMLGPRLQPPPVPRWERPQPKPHAGLRLNGIKSRGTSPAGMSKKRVVPPPAKKRPVDVSSSKLSRAGSEQRLLPSGFGKKLKKAITVASETPRCSTSRSRTACQTYRATEKKRRLMTEESSTINISTSRITHAETTQTGEGRGGGRKQRSDSVYEVDSPVRLSQLLRYGYSFQYQERRMRKSQSFRSELSMCGSSSYMTRRVSTTFLCGSGGTSPRYGAGVVPTRGGTLKDITVAPNSTRAAGENRSMRAMKRKGENTLKKNERFLRPLKQSASKKENWAGAAARATIKRMVIDVI